MPILKIIIMKDKKMNIEEYQVDDMDIDFDDIKIMIYKNKEKKWINIKPFLKKIIEFLNISENLVVINEEISGTNGTSGTSGINGTSGSSGTSGTDGTSGTSGFINYTGTRDYQIVMWSGDTWQVTDKLISPGSFTFDPKKGVMSYETSEEGHYEMVFFGSDFTSGLTNTKQGDILVFDGEDWINSDSGLTYSRETLSVSNLNITDNFEFGSTMFNESVGNKIPMIITKTDTGDPIGTEGIFCINIYDNNFKIYADGGWRTITTW